MAENYRLNIHSVLRSNLPAERKRTILSRLLEQITALYENSPDSLSQNVEDMTEEEQAALCAVCNEAKEALQKLTSRT